MSVVDESAEALVGGSDEGVMPAILNSEPVAPLVPVPVVNPMPTPPALFDNGLTGRPKLKAGVIVEAAADVDALLTPPPPRPPPPTAPPVIPKANELNGLLFPEEPDDPADSALPCNKLIIDFKYLSNMYTITLLKSYHFSASLNNLSISQIFFIRTAKFTLFFGNIFVIPIIMIEILIGATFQICHYPTTGNFSLTIFLQ